MFATSQFLHERFEFEANDHLLLVLETDSVIVHIPREVEINETTAVEVCKYIRAVVYTRLVEGVSEADEGIARLQRLEVIAVIESVLKSEEPPVGIEFDNESVVKETLIDLAVSLPAEDISGSDSERIERCIFGHIGPKKGMSVYIVHDELMVRCGE